MNLTLEATMRISSATLNMVTVLRRARPDLWSQAVSSHSRLTPAGVRIRTFSDFCPLYSVSDHASQLKKYTKRHDSLIYQARLANTSSGFYAPSSAVIASNRQIGGHESHGNLSVFEDSEHLPSLPVPNLNSTLERLKESISPVAMNSAEFVHALQLIDEFAVSAGPKLDLLLRNKASQTKNWLTHDWWVKEAYLKNRKPLVINSNPSMIYPTLPYEVNNQRALVNVISQLISGIIDFKLSLIHGYNPEATSADNECRLDPNLCYNQYKRIFGATRLPGERLDSVKINPVIPGNLDSVLFGIVISYRGKFFQVQLKDFEDENGRIDKLTGILDKIISSHKPSDERGQVNGAGVLTATGRDNWAQAIKLLDADSMSAIQEAQFVVCIDTISRDSDKFSNSLLDNPLNSEQHAAALGRQILHADSDNVGNRWFDKSLQLIVVADDNAENFLGAGVNFEHSNAEGIVVAKLIEHSFDKTVQKYRESSNANFFVQQQVSSKEPATFRQLRMFDENNLDDIDKELKQAKQDFVSQVDQFDLSYLDYKQYGSNAIKSWHFSPDSWFQVAMQSAYYNLHKRLGPCYESASTRRFAYGRTETIRSLTKEVAQFCLEPRFDTLQMAIQSHKSIAISANNGDSIDRVLSGYKLTFDELKTNSWSWGLPTNNDGFISQLKLSKQKRNNAAESTTTENQGESSTQAFDIGDLFTEDELNTVSAFFNNELIGRSTRFALSTSQVASVHPNIYMTYGPLLADGYGCCYNITGQQIVAAITANSSNQSFSCEVHKLNESIRNSMDTMKNIIEEQRSKSNN